MKKTALLKGGIALMMSALLMAGCSNATNNTESTTTEETMQESSLAEQTTAEDKEGEKISVVSTIFPSYDWVREVIGSRADEYDMTLLLDKGTDLHSYQPTAEDIAKIANCDLFIYVGGESDYWVDDALKESNNPNMQVINLVEALGDKAKEEEFVEGMQEEAEHDHDHDAEEADHDHDHDAEEAEHDHDHDAEEADHDHDHDAEEADHDHDHEHPEYDEHVWLSLENAKILVDSIEEAIATLDTANAAEYEKNTKDYIAKLDELNEEYKTAVNNGTRKHLLFGDRFPFRYLVDDYDIEYYAAFIGCSAETEASFETVAFLADKVDELDIQTVLTIENSDQKIAKTIIENTKNKNQDIKVLNSLQSVTSADLDNGVNYLSVMKENLEVLNQVLN